MEKVHNAKTTQQNNKSLLIAGFFIQVECCICGMEATFSGCTKTETLKHMTSEGWRDLDSDFYGMIGHYCGCHYETT